MPKPVQLDALEKTVMATLYSAYVIDEKPLSLLIVAIARKRQDSCPQISREQGNSLPHRLHSLWIDS